MATDNSPKLKVSDTLQTTGAEEGGGGTNGGRSSRSLAPRTATATKTSIQNRNSSSCNQFAPDYFNSFIV